MTGAELDPRSLYQFAQRVAGWIKTVAAMVASIEELKRQNTVLQRSLDEMRRIVDTQTGQMLMMEKFVEKAVEAEVLKRLDQERHRN